MTDKGYRYDQMVEKALRDVVRGVMEDATKNGLPGDHHFYISFLTPYPGVEVPEFLTQQYPHEMTIVLQHQFFGLVIRETDFTVTLSFNGAYEKLTIPFAAISGFADPSVKFALQFHTTAEQMEKEQAKLVVASASLRGFNKDDAKREGDENEGGAEVVSLDAFRKK